jgi:polyisoprenyl-teichoic acid--peptidoglycan teichoic acid transferase
VLYSSGAVVDAAPGSPGDGGRPSRPGRAGAARTGKKKRKRAKAPLWSKLLIIFGVVLALGSGLTIGGVKLTFAEATKNIDRKNLLGGEGAAAQKHVSINGPQNILLMGLDNRPGQNANDLVRSDSIIIVHIPANHDAAYLISIPRDLWVHVPAYPKTHFFGQDEKINAAFAFGNQKGGGPSGGVELLAKTIHQYWGITFNAAAIVDFEGFQQVVNVLGGVDMYVDQETTSVHIGYDKNGKEKMPYRIDSSGRVAGKVPGVTPVVYHVGQQHLAPWQALDYVRQRELLPNGDYDRERHQQQFIKAIFKGIMTKNVLLDPGKLGKVLDVVGKSMTLDTGGISIQDWIFGMKGISGNSMVTIKTNNGTYHADANGKESLDANTVTLLGAVKSDTVGDFVVQHPNLVTNS